MTLHPTYHPALLHLTLNTGSSKECSLADITEDLLPKAVHALERILEKQTCVPMAFDGEEWFLSGSSHGTGLILQLWRGTWNNKLLFMSTATAPDAEAASLLWPRIHQVCGSPLCTSPEILPTQLPWTADCIEPAAAYFPQAASWLWDFTAVLGLAWLTYLSSKELPIQ